MRLRSLHECRTAHWILIRRSWYPVRKPHSRNIFQAFPWFPYSQTVRSSAPAEYTPFPDAASCSPKIPVPSAVRVPRSGSAHRKTQMYLPDQNNPEGSTVPCRNRTKKHPFPRFPTILPIPVPVLLPVTVPDRLPRFSFLSAIYRKKLLLPLTVCGYLLLSLRSKEPVHMPDIPQAFLYFQ